jgi:hypothetical protein
MGENNVETGGWRPDPNDPRGKPVPTVSIDPDGGEWAALQLGDLELIGRGPNPTLATMHLVSIAADWLLALWDQLAEAEAAMDTLEESLEAPQEIPDPNLVPAAGPGAVPLMDLLRLQSDAKGIILKQILDAVVAIGLEDKPGEWNHTPTKDRILRKVSDAVTQAAVDNLAALAISKPEVDAAMETLLAKQPDPEPAELLRGFSASGEPKEPQARAGRCGCPVPMLMMPQLQDGGFCLRCGGSCG